MRVLLTVPSLSPAFGGPPVVAAALRDGLEALGHEVEVLGCGDGSLPVLTRFHGTPVPSRWKPILRAVELADVVHVLGYRDPVGTAAALAATRRGVPLVVEPLGMHRTRLRSVGLKAGFDRLLGDRLLRKAVAIVATSRLEAAELVEDGVLAARIHVRPNGVGASASLPLPPRGGLRGRLDIPMDAPMVLSLGRIAAKKGLLDLVEALSHLPGVIAVVAGPSDPADGTLRRVTRRARAISVFDRVRLIPKGLWGLDKAQAFAEADCFCLPSATENFGMAAAEAAAAGVPAVVSDRCGVAEWLEPEATRVVPYGSVNLLARALADVVGDPRVSRCAQEEADGVRRTLEWGALSRLQSAIYEGAVDGKRQSGRPVGTALVDPGQGAKPASRGIRW